MKDFAKRCLCISSLHRRSPPVARRSIISEIPKIGRRQLEMGNVRPIGNGKWKIGVEGEGIFTKLNPIGYVPVLVDEDFVVSDSFAILLVSGLGIYPLHLMSAYLEEKYPQHLLLPRDLQRRAINYQKYIAEKVNSDEQYVWARNHIGKGFEALEKLLHDYAGKYATGDEVYLTPYPLLSRLNEAYNQLPAFVDSAPENQPDTPV
ncbi:hypothetical protein C3L33_21922, partial [Rhododendron williamsianum]